MTEPESCVSCRFYLPGRTNAEPFQIAGGLCRRYAPTGPAVLPSGGAWQVFPPMTPHQWCGDYRPADGPVVGRGRMAA